MKRFTFSLLFALGATAAYAQDGLTPTDVLEGGKLALTGRLQFASGQAQLVQGGVDADVDIQQFQFQFAGAVGLGMGFEVEAFIPYQFINKTEIDTFPSETEIEEIGFGDLTVSPIYRILKDGTDSPQLIIGALFVAPTGKTEPAEPGSGPIDGEEGGIGDAVWRFGAIVGISKRVGVAEPYLTISWLSGGEGDIQSDEIEVERPDHLVFTFGSEFHLSPQVTLDLRGAFDFEGEQIKTLKASGAEEIEEEHFTNAWQAQLYFTAGPGVTLILGLAVALIEDHTIHELANRDIEDTFVYAATIGIHINLGM